jgi:hypothetical protein
MLTACLLIPHMSELTGIDARLFSSKSPTDWELERHRLSATVFLDHDTLRAGLVNSWQTKLARSGFPSSSMETGALMKDHLASLYAELRAIELWDASYRCQQSRDEVDEMAFRARQERRQEILQELRATSRPEDLRPMPL